MYQFKDPPEVKLIILYIIKNYGTPIDNGQITDIFMAHEFVDYFSMQQYLDEMVENGLVDIDRSGKVRLYTLTQLGNEAYEYFIGRIPRTVRETVLLSIKAYRREQREAAEITATYAPMNELEYSIDCAVQDGVSTLLRINMAAGSAESAKEACHRFKENPQKIYAELIRILMS